MTTDGDRRSRDAVGSTGSNVSIVLLDGWDEAHMTTESDLSHFCEALRRWVSIQSSLVTGLADRGESALIARIFERLASRQEPRGPVLRCVTRTYWWASTRRSIPEIGTGWMNDDNVAWPDRRLHPGSAGVAVRSGLVSLLPAADPARGAKRGLAASALSDDRAHLCSYQMVDSATSIVIPAWLSRDGTAGLLRLVRGLIALLRRMIVLALTVLSRGADVIRFVLILIATCLRYGQRREEPDHRRSLLPHRFETTAGRRSAVR